jgi:hypothetical protein
VVVVLLGSVARWWILIAVQQAFGQSQFPLQARYLRRTPREGAVSRATLIVYCNTLHSLLSLFLLLFFSLLKSLYSLPCYSSCSLILTPLPSYHFSLSLMSSSILSSKYPILSFTLFCSIFSYLKLLSSSNLRRAKEEDSRAFLSS